MILENKATNLIPVRVLKVDFNFCFRRVTEEGYSVSQLSPIQSHPTPNPSPQAGRGGAAGEGFFGCISRKRESLYMLTILAAYLSQ
jgi:hypothetical protein